MKIFSISHLTVEAGKKESAQGSIPSCCACKKPLLKNVPYVCLRPDGFLTTRPKYPIYFCRNCWEEVIERF